FFFSIERDLKKKKKSLFAKNVTLNVQNKVDMAKGFAPELLDANGILKIKARDVKMQGYQLQSDTKSSSLSASVATDMTKITPSACFSKSTKSEIKAVHTTLNPKNTHIEADNVNLIGVNVNARMTGRVKKMEAVAMQSTTTECTNGGKVSGEYRGQWTGGEIGYQQKQLRNVTTEKMDLVALHGSTLEIDSARLTSVQDSGIVANDVARNELKDVAEKMEMEFGLGVHANGFEASAQIDKSGFDAEHGNFSLKAKIRNRGLDMHVKDGEREAGVQLSTNGFNAHIKDGERGAGVQLNTNGFDAHIKDGKHGASVQLNAKGFGVHVKDGEREAGVQINTNGFDAHIKDGEREAGVQLNTNGFNAHIKDGKHGAGVQFNANGFDAHIKDGEREAGVQINTNGFDAHIKDGKHGAGVQLNAKGFGVHVKDGEHKAGIYINDSGLDSSFNEQHMSIRFDPCYNGYQVGAGMRDMEFNAMFNGHTVGAELCDQQCSAHFDDNALNLQMKDKKFDAKINQHNFGAQKLENGFHAYCDDYKLGLQMKDKGFDAEINQHNFGVQKLEKGFHAYCDDYKLGLQMKDKGFDAEINQHNFGAQKIENGFAGHYNDHNVTLQKEDKGVKGTYNENQFGASRTENGVAGYYNDHKVTLQKEDEGVKGTYNEHQFGAHRTENGVAAYVDKHKAGARLDSDGFTAYIDQKNVHITAKQAAIATCVTATVAVAYGLYRVLKLNNLEDAIQSANKEKRMLEVLKKKLDNPNDVIKVIYEKCLINPLKETCTTALPQLLSQSTLLLRSPVSKEWIEAIVNNDHSAIIQYTHSFVIANIIPWFVPN
ncbi:hypothetical protein RFI_16211, partial [Reticulomyxa filosa]